MKTLSIIILLALIAFSCQKELSPETILSSIPTLTTTAATSITNTTAASGGNITDDGGAPITVRGICWSTSPNPVLSGSRTTDGTGAGVYVSNITGLTAMTVYYVRAYASNSVGTAYGNEITFTTTNTSTALPTITTAATSAVTITTATSGGNITTDGGAPVTARGVCWSTTANPTAVLSTKTIDGTGTGIFASAITGLTAATLYHVRAYATNSVGTSYGGDSTFTTAAGTTIPTITTAAVSGINTTSVTGGGTISSDGGAPVTARGVCWSTTTNPTIALSTKTTDGSGIGTFTSAITGLTKSTLYHVRAFATNSVGTAYGNDIIFTTPEFDTYIGGCSPANDEAAIWKNGVPTLLTTGTGIVYCIYVVNQDVYAGGIELIGGLWVAKTWKNGVATTLSDGTDNANVQSIFVSGTDVYAVGSDKGKAMIWKNGIGTLLLNGNSANSVFISGADVYACGNSQATWNAPSYAVFWKNNVFTDLTNRTGLSNANAIRLMGSDVYIGGREDMKAAIWKNGIISYLSDGTKFNMITTLYINGVDVYAGGFESVTSGGLRIAKYWKNGTPVNLTNGSTYASVNSIFKFGSDLYVYGKEDDFSQNITIWKNGVPSNSNVILSNNYNNYAVFLR